MNDPFAISEIVAEVADALRTPTPPLEAPPPVVKVLGQNRSRAASEQAAALEEQFFQLTNAARAAAGVPPVGRNPDLENYARSHAAAMAANGRIYHSPIEALLGEWWMVGENVGTGPDAPSIETAYEHSPGHYANIIHPAFQYIGVGVVLDGARVYTAEDYGI